MEKNRLGKSDLLVSKMGLGCMSLGTDGKKAGDIIKEALDHGINYLDTADLYEFGTNEEIVGHALKGQRDKVILATKVGNRWTPGKEGWEWDPSKEHIKSGVKDSLKRLQTDYIDLYQLHGGTIEDPAEESIEAFEELKKEGYIREYGISSIRPNVIKRFTESSAIVSVMMQYSMLDTRPEEYLDYLHAYNVSVVARGPLAKGLLSNSGLEKAKEKAKDKGYLDYSYDELVELIGKLQDSIQDRPLQSVALHYCLAHPSVAAVIPGASSVDQLRANISAMEYPPLTESEMEKLKSFLKQSQYDTHRD
ncbi:aryl-alcohol dehydrogenase-like predicted oxidoreductase [Bacillus tianshenii]|uniref:Aryl-alcohol dehydrogenase-like predicted oxidoreductase n=1 Tax=Sutcliffiella tianshenii TaxID=1463404 RepID=A0ABS2P2T2_9BACI|nr:aldo/keto reductase [Bacillus tianshenii]MBM7621266.1 aryl-alcohol dehydrogenase-like predicted oxidoreductase [Bacillus tianshenii]